MSNKSEWFGDKLMEGIEKKLFTRVKLASNFVKDEAKRRCPVDTGNLKDTIDIEMKIENGEIVGSIGTNVEYAAHVEYGDEKGKEPRKVGQMPFLRPALLENKENIKKIIGD